MCLGSSGEDSTFGGQTYNALLCGALASRRSTASLQTLRIFLLKSCTSGSLTMSNSQTGMPIAKPTILQKHEEVIATEN